MELLDLDKSLSKEELYLQVQPQLHALLIGEEDKIANLANFCAVLKEAFQWWWVGFYFVKGNELVLGPFQGPVACTRISFGKGVCGKAWESKSAIIVPDVHQFPGHIACSSASNSEIVLPVFSAQNELVAVLDVDSQFFNHFDEVDEKYLATFLTYLAL